MNETELRALETAMWQTETRTDLRWMEAHLAPEFTEFGQSGRSYTRSEILALPIADVGAELPLVDFRTRHIADDVALVTYRVTSRGRPTNRASVWSRREGHWLLEFHQGTPATDGRT